MSNTHYKLTKIWLTLHVLFVAVFFEPPPPPLPKKKINIKCNVIKSTIYIQGELDSLQGIEIG
jgi:hypothetical protein